MNDGGTANDPTDDTIDFIPAANYNGPVSINYTIEDLDGETSTATVTFNVTSVNDVPVAVNDTPSDVAEDSGLTNLSILGNDDFGGDGPNIGSITVTPLASNIGTAVLNNGGTPNDPTDDTIDFTPAANYYGPVLINYTIKDLDGKSDEEFIKLLESYAKIFKKSLKIKQIFIFLLERSNCNIFLYLTAKLIG